MPLNLAEKLPLAVRRASSSSTSFSTSFSVSMRATCRHVKFQLGLQAIKTTVTALHLTMSWPTQSKASVLGESQTRGLADLHIAMWVSLPQQVVPDAGRKQLEHLHTT